MNYSSIFISFLALIKGLTKIDTVLHLHVNNAKSYNFDTSRKIDVNTVHENNFDCLFEYRDTGYPHDGRVDNTAYRHDRRADKRRYPHDREIDIQMLKCLEMDTF